MNNHQRARVHIAGAYLAGAGGQRGVGPVEEPLGVLSAQIHAAVAHRLAEVAVPIRPVQRIARVEVHRIRYVRQVVTGPGHVRRR